MIPATTVGAVGGAGGQTVRDAEEHGSCEGTWPKGTWNQWSLRRRGGCLKFFQRSLSWSDRFSLSEAQILPTSGAGMYLQRLDSGPRRVAWNDVWVQCKPPRALLTAPRPLPTEAAVEAKSQLGELCRPVACCYWIPGFLARGEAPARPICGQALTRPTVGRWVPAATWDRPVSAREEPCGRGVLGSWDPRGGMDGGGFALRSSSGPAAPSAWPAVAAAAGDPTAVRAQGPPRSAAPALGRPAPPTLLRAACPPLFRPIHPAGGRVPWPSPRPSSPPARSGGSPAPSAPESSAARVERPLPQPPGRCERPARPRQRRQPALPTPARLSPPSRACGASRPNARTSLHAPTLPPRCSPDPRHALGCARTAAGSWAPEADGEPPWPPMMQSACRAWEAARLREQRLSQEGCLPSGQSRWTHRRPSHGSPCSKGMLWSHILDQSPIFWF